MKYDVTVKDEVTLQNIRYVYDLGPGLDMKKIGFMLFRLSLEKQIWVAYGKNGILATFACSMNVTFDYSHRISSDFYITDVRQAEPSKIY